MEAFSAEQPTSSGTRMPQSPRRPVHQLPSQRIPVRRQSVGRLAPGVPGSAVSHIERLRIYITMFVRTSVWNLDPLFFPLPSAAALFRWGWQDGSQRSHSGGASPLWWFRSGHPVSVTHVGPQGFKELHVYTNSESPGFIVTCSLCSSTENLSVEK